VNDRPAGTPEHARIYAWVKELLVQHRLLPGEQLLIGELAAQLRVSPTPVRETLIRLQAEGFLDPTRRRGFFTKTPTLREMTELHQLRFTLLQAAIELMVREAPCMDEPLVAAFAAASLAPIAEGPVPAPQEEAQTQALCIERAYEAIISVAGSRTMMDLVRNINDRTHYFATISLESPQRLEVSYATLRQLAAALRQGDFDAAVAALRLDLDASLEALSAAIKEGISRSYVSVREAAPSGTCATAR
jgi:DNA-binding GntR family transcriptional regulator